MLQPYNSLKPYPCTLGPRDAEMIGNTGVVRSSALIMGNNASIFELTIILLMQNNPRRTYCVRIMEIGKGKLLQPGVDTTVPVREGLCTMVARNLSVSVIMGIVAKMLLTKKIKSMNSMSLLRVKPVLTLSGERCFCCSLMTA